jgi:hypothetical protein
VPTAGETIEVVRGKLGDDRADQVVDFWTRHGAADGAEARERLAEVVCVALDDAGQIVGVNAVREETAPLIGRRSFVYRSQIADGANRKELSSGMFNAAFEALESEFELGRPGPIGVCVLISDRDEIERRPEVHWPEEDLTYAGYADDGSQVRVRYFEDAEIEPGLPNSPSLAEAQATDYSIADRYSVVPYTGSGAATAEDILAMWTREGVVPEAEARRRVHEALNVVIDQDEGVIAVSTAYLQRNAQLGMDLWYFRTFVSSAHRNTHVATQLTFHNRDLLESRFVSGEDTRAAGVVFELENEGMRKYFNRAIWLPADFVFVGDNRKGVPVRVHYFPGALVGAPPAPS